MLSTSTSTSYLLFNGFEILDVLPKNDEVKHTHNVLRGRKRAQSDRDKLLEKFNHIWYIKQIESSKHRLPRIKRAYIEVVSQEFLRLFYPEQPKTRIVLDQDDKIYIASKGIIDFSPLDENCKSKIEQNQLHGLGILAVLSLLLDERDFKNGNVGMSLANILKIDGDRCFGRIRIKDSYIVTEKDIAALPLVEDHQAFNWLGSMSEGKKKTSSIVDASFSEILEVCVEINRTLLLALIFPINMFENFVRYYVNDDDFAKTLIDAFGEQQAQLMHAALLDANFRDYVTNCDLDALTSTFIAQLKNFKSVHKDNPFTKMDDFSDTIFGISKFIYSVASPKQTSLITVLPPVSDNQAKTILHEVDHPSHSIASKTEFIAPLYQKPLPFVSTTEVYPIENHKMALLTSYCDKKRKKSEEAMSRKKRKTTHSRFFNETKSEVNVIPENNLQLKTTSSNYNSGNDADLETSDSASGTYQGRYFQDPVQNEIKAERKKNIAEKPRSIEGFLCRSSIPLFFTSSPSKIEQDDNVVLPASKELSV